MRFVGNAACVPLGSGVWREIAGGGAASLVSTQTPIHPSGQYEAGHDYNESSPAVRPACRQLRAEVLGQHCGREDDEDLSPKWDFRDDGHTTWYARADALTRRPSHARRQDSDSPSGPRDGDNCAMGSDI